MEGQRKTRLLLADDSITIRKVVEMTLPSDRLKITSVGDGEAALEAMGNERPDVLLADVIMPKMDGYELCAVVRSSPEFKDIPVILLVGTFENYDEVRGREAGADDYIVKPFETHDLIEKIRAVTRPGAGETKPPAEVPSGVAVDTPVALSPETVSHETEGPEEIALEYSDRVEFDSRKEPVGLVEASSAERALESFETLSDVPTHHEFCAEEAACPEPGIQAVAATPEETPEEASVAVGDENFPWEEEIDLPEEGPGAAAEPSVGASVVEEPPAFTEEHVFSLADFKPDVIEALAKGDELTPPPVSEVEADALLASLAGPEETATVTPQPEEMPQPEASPSTLTGSSLEELRECIEKSVHDAVLNAFGGFFREAVEKAARDVVPAIVEKAVREELERHRG